MANVVAFESVTLDGVMQAPGRPDEDTRDGFAHGGWAAPYALLIHPLLLGSGRRLFEAGLPVTSFALTDSRTSTTGVVIATYERVTAG